MSRPLREELFFLFCGFPYPNENTSIKHIICNPFPYSPDRLLVSYTNIHLINTLTSPSLPKFPFLLSFFLLLVFQVRVTLSSRSEGGKALMSRPLREELFFLFCGFPYPNENTSIKHIICNPFPYSPDRLLVSYTNIHLINTLTSPSLPKFPFP